MLDRGADHIVLRAGIPREAFEDQLADQVVIHQGMYCVQVETLDAREVLYNIRQLSVFGRALMNCPSVFSADPLAKNGAGKEGNTAGHVHSLSSWFNVHAACDKGYGHPEVFVLV